MGDGGRVPAIAVVAAVGQFRVGHPMPLLRLEIDHAVIGACDARPQADETQHGSTQRWKQERQAERVGDEAGDDQKHAGKKDHAAGRIRLQGAEIALGHGDAEARNVAAAGVAQQQHPGDAA